MNFFHLWVVVHNIGASLIFSKGLCHFKGMCENDLREKKCLHSQFSDSQILKVSLSLLLSRSLLFTLSWIHLYISVKSVRMIEPQFPAALSRCITSQPAGRTSLPLTLTDATAESQNTLTLWGSKSLIWINRTEQSERDRERMCVCVCSYACIRETHRLTVWDKEMVDGKSSLSTRDDHILPSYLCLQSLPCRSQPFR